ncbi:MmgE/PrpD family protein [Roseomonas sp. HJA6]|uniref:MmgE/PrpD family protein n=1 Tax=Roseomonas alba TaxID=2846776 RepID=A0ABS7A967_9PROT|nr:MmgE/PrpD family protein [Neoroseomonas alba]MBW6398847.1 MmgE/PrpD family protein [Neoroseomonas alba]
MTATETLATWVATVPRTRTAAVAPLATAGMRDAIGCILAGAQEETPRRVAAAVTRWGSGPSHVIGSGRALPSPWAALVNGTAAHVLDYDDTFGPLSGHATAVLVPSILALGEEIAADGPALLDALVVGLDVMAAVGRGVNPKHYALGWHATSTIGAIGAAGACARLMNLDARGAQDALSLAVSMAAGTRMQLGAPAKSLHAGLAAKAGILAATLAAEGVGGAAEALEGQWRFVEMFTGRPAPEGVMAPPADDAPLAIESDGLAFKAYPTCAATHLSLDALLALRPHFAPEEVTAIETDLPLVLRRNLMHPDPRTGMEARFSMEYCLAAAATQGALGPADFEGAALVRPPVRALMPRIAMQGLPEPDGAPPPATTVRVRLADGRVLTETRTIRRGSPDNPMSEAELVAKFRDCASRLLPPERVAAAEAAIAGLASGGSARDLVALLSG